jgi:hypothetical protein
MRMSAKSKDPSIDLFFAAKRSHLTRYSSFFTPHALQPTPKLGVATKYIAPEFKSPRWARSQLAQIGGLDD